MGMPKKYLFDVSFDQVAEKDEPPPVREETFTRGELDEARHIAYTEGRGVGLAEATAAAATKAATALEAIAAALPAFMASQDERAAEIQRQAIAALRVVIAKALPAYAAREPLAEIEALAGKCLMEAIDEPRVVLRVANEIYEPMRERIDALAATSGYGGRIVLLGDDALSGGDIRIEWADGGAERRLAEQMNEIDAALARIADPSATPTPPSP
jgi:flagellar assembly protein FliH